MCRTTCKSEEVALLTFICRWRQKMFFYRKSHGHNDSYFCWCFFTSWNLIGLQYRHEFRYLKKRQLQGETSCSSSLLNKPFSSTGNKKTRLLLLRFEFNMYTFTILCHPVIPPDQCMPSTLSLIYIVSTLTSTSYPAWSQSLRCWFKLSTDNRERGRCKRSTQERRTLSFELSVVELHHSHWSSSWNVDS